MYIVPPEIRGLIFDCDGTLADTMPCHYQAWSAVLAEHGVQIPYPEIFEVAGMSTPEIAAFFNRRYGLKMDLVEAGRKKEHYLAPLLATASPITPIVDIVKKYFGMLPMAVATGGDAASSQIILQTLGILDCFGAVVGGNDVERGKPHPDIFLEAARRIGVTPTHCMVFEDGEFGIQGAEAAGMTVIDVRPMLNP